MSQTVLPPASSPTAGRAADPRAGLCAAQGLYYLATGIWPLLDMKSFQAVTGPKTDNWTGREADHWLVKTVGVVVAAVGAALLTAGKRGQTDGAIPVLAVGSALGLAAIDCVYVARGVIAPIYLADAAAEVALAAAWFGAAPTDQKSAQVPSTAWEL